MWGHRQEASGSEGGPWLTAEKGTRSNRCEDLDSDTNWMNVEQSLF